MIQDVLITLNIFQSRFMLLHQGFDFQPDQLIQPHLQNRRRLRLCKTQAGSRLFGGFGFKLNPFCHSVYQAFLHLLLTLAPPEDFNNQVNHIAGFDQSFLNLALRFFFFQKRPVFSGGQLKLEINVVLQNTSKPHRLRPSVADRQHIHAEGVLQPRFLI